MVHQTGAECERRMHVPCKNDGRKYTRLEHVTLHNACLVSSEIIEGKDGSLRNENLAGLEDTWYKITFRTSLYLKIETRDSFYFLFLSFLRCLKVCNPISVTSLIILIIDGTLDGQEFLYFSLEVRSAFTK